MGLLMEYSDYYNDYFLWNDALWKYYFEGNTTSEQVLLYADDNIIRDIGRNCGALKDRFEELEGHDDYLEFFYESILFNKREDIKHFFYLKRTLRGIPQRSITEEYLSEARISSVLQAYNRQTIQTTAIIDFARALASITNQGFSHKCPCLSYVVFLILEYNRSRSYEGIISRLREKSGLSNANILPEQFMELFRSVEIWSKRDTIPGFSADRIRGEQQLVGVLRYHLVLNRAETIELQDALYEYKVDWDESELSYRDLVYNYILPIITRDATINALRKPENYTFFYSIFHGFSLDSYKPSWSIPQKQRGHFYLLYDREEKHFLLKTDILASDKNSRNDNVILSCSGDRECGLYGAYYLNGEIGLNVYKDLYYENESLKVTSIKRDWLFFIMSGKYFKQVLTPVDNEGCLIITRKSLDEVRKTFNQDSMLDYTQHLNTIFGDGFNVFFTERWKPNKIFTDNQKDDEQDDSQFIVGPRLTNGILNPALKRCYLPEALPVIQCEQEISIENVDIYEDREHSRRALCIDKEFISGNNIVRLSLNKVTNTYQEFYVVVSDEEIGVIRVKGSNTEDGENSIWYDSWGCGSVTKYENSIFCDNRTVCDGPNKCNIDNDKIYSKTSKKCLVPLLKSYAFARKETNRRYLLDRDISKIINYVSLVEQWNIDSDDLSYVKYHLINFGILSMATDDCSERRFEVNNPQLVSVENNKYLLYGGYTFLQFEEIKQSHEISGYETIEVPGIFSDLLLVDINKDIETISHIRISKQPLVDILFQITQRMVIEKFKEEFMNTPESVEGNNQNGCFFRTPSKRQFFNSIQEDDKLYALYRREDYTFQQIPTPLQKLYVCRVNNKPLMMWNEDTNTISFDWNMGVPYYVERALCLLNMGLGTRRRVFGMGNFLGNKLYSTITSFQLKESKYKDCVFSILSNDEISTLDGILKYQEYEGCYSLFYRVKEEEYKSGITQEFVLMKDDHVELVVRHDYGKVTALGSDNGKQRKIIGNDVNGIISNYINGIEPEWGNPIENDIFTHIPNIYENYQKLTIIKKIL